MEALTKCLYSIMSVVVVILLKNVKRAGRINTMGTLAAPHCTKYYQAQSPDKSAEKTLSGPATILSSFPQNVIAFPYSVCIQQDHSGLHNGYKLTFCCQQLDIVLRGSHHLDNHQQL